MRALLIAEKPSLKVKIEKCYQKYREKIPYTMDFVALAGHIDYMKQPKDYDEWGKERWPKWSLDMLPIFPDESKCGWQYGITPSKMNIFKELKEKLKGNYDFVIHCGDSDQEGEILVNRALKMAGNKLPVKRYWEQELTDEAILKSLLNLGSDSDDFYRNLNLAGELRAEYDYLTGMNGSTAASVICNSRVALGRVMSPSLNILAMREREIQNYKPIPLYEIIEEYDGFTGVCFDEAGNIQFKTKGEADGFLKKLSGKAIVKSIEQKEEKRYAPKLFKLNTLQAEAGKLGIGLDQSTTITQQLYEAGLISYPRTDCSEVGTSTAVDFTKLLSVVATIPELSQYVGCVSPKDIARVKSMNAYVNDASVAAGNHTAIIPTFKKPNIQDLGKDALEILKLVYKRFLAIFMPPQIKDRTTVITEDGGYSFKATGFVVKQDGWTVLYKKDGNEEQKDEDRPIRVSAAEGDIIAGVPGVKEKIPAKPKRFTDAEFTSVMESPARYLVNSEYRDIIKSVKGIGTQATRSAIIKKLESQGYITLSPVKAGKDVNYIYVTGQGLSLIEALEGRDIINVDMTAEMEERLEQVRHGKLQRETFVSEMKQKTLAMIEDLKRMDHMKISRIGNHDREVLGECPNCKGGVIHAGKAFFCEKKCGFIFPAEFLGAKITDNEAKHLLNGKNITKTLTKKDGTKWEQKLRIGETGDFKTKERKLGLVFVKDEINVLHITCPKCGKPIKSSEKYFMCENYKSGCDFIFGKTFKGAKFSENDFMTLLSGGSIEKLFKWDSGKSSRNMCHLENCRLKIVFNR